jgi:hypothetical protein
MSDTKSKDLDIIWGAKAIGEAMGLDERRVFVLLQNNQIPGAKKFGMQWCIARAKLRELFGLEGAA